jgi:hypothetical protein
MHAFTKSMEERPFSYAFSQLVEERAFRPALQAAMKGALAPVPAAALTKYQIPSTRYRLFRP